MPRNVQVKTESEKSYSYDSAKELLKNVKMTNLFNAINRNTQCYKENGERFIFGTLDKNGQDKCSQLEFVVGLWEYLTGAKMSDDNINKINTPKMKPDEIFSKFKKMIEEEIERTNNPMLAVGLSEVMDVAAYTTVPEQEINKSLYYNDPNDPFAVHIGNAVKRSRDPNRSSIKITKKPHGFAATNASDVIGVVVANSILQKADDALVVNDELADNAPAIFKSSASVEITRNSDNTVTIQHKAELQDITVGKKGELEYLFTPKQRQEKLNSFNKELDVLSKTAVGLARGLIRDNRNMNEFSKKIEAVRESRESQINLKLKSLYENYFKILKDEVKSSQKTGFFDKYFDFSGIEESKNRKLKHIQEWETIIGSATDKERTKFLSAMQKNINDIQPISLATKLYNAIFGIKDTEIDVDAKVAVEKIVRQAKVEQIAELRKIEEDKFLAESEAVEVKEKSEKGIAASKTPTAEMAQMIEKLGDESKAIEDKQKAEQSSSLPDPHHPPITTKYDDSSSTTVKAPDTTTPTTPGQKPKT